MFVGDVCVGRRPVSGEVRRQLLWESAPFLLCWSLPLKSGHQFGQQVPAHPEPSSCPPEISTLINCKVSQRIQTSICVTIERMTKRGKHASNFFSSVFPLKSQEEEVGQTEIMLRSHRTKHEIEGKTLLSLGSQS